jgi:hypothetical protein
MIVVVLVVDETHSVLLPGGQVTHVMKESGNDEGFARPSDVARAAH